jgi:hypothetical protein
VQHEIDEQTSHPNLPGAVGLGALAAALGSVGWFAVARLAVAAEGGVGWVVVGMLAIGIGWLVGKAVVLGSGNKRGPSLQLISATLSSIPLFGGRYLLLNHLMSRQMAASFTNWLTPSQFLTIYGRLLMHGAIIVDLGFLALAIACGAVQPSADKLFSEPPPWARQRM